MKFWTTKLFLLLTVFVFAVGADAQRERSISAVQGEGNLSPFQGESVRLEGIVTARLKAGFFIQTPDDKTDGNPKTSEGIYVYTRTEPTQEATIGNLVSVTGKIEEFRYKTDTTSLTITELSMQKNVDTIRVVSKGNPLPKAVTITTADFASNDFDALEKYEGMRVFVPEMTVVAPTYAGINNKTGIATSAGTFFGVLKGTPRPFREPGMDVHELFSASEKDRARWKRDHPKIAIFDSNPEAIRVDSSAQLGAQTIDVTTQSEIKNLSGVMHYGFGKYTIVTDVDNNAVISNSIKSKPLPAPTERQFSLAAMNLENFFDDEDDPSIREDIVTREAFEARLKKISLAVRDYLQFPDIIGVTEAENLVALKKLADRINADATALKQANPKYEAYLVDGNDGRGIDVGFLVKSSRVNVLEVKQIGKDETYKEPKGKEAILNDRPPLLIRAEIEDSETGKPFPLTVIVNHLKSFLGYDDPKDGGLRVRTKKKIQAEFLARLVQERQKAGENVVTLGDFNAYQFNDGITDIIGTIKGTPASKEEVLMASEDLVEPDLINLVDLIQADQRYSYTFDGNAQTLDHILISQSLRKYLLGFGFGRFNADFPGVYRNDTSRVERFSDHDVAVAYFSLDEKQTAGSGSK